MNKQIAFWCIVLTLWGCTSKKENEIALFNDTTFSLMPGERAVPVDAEAKEQYYAYLNNTTNIQIPLFKCITSAQYRMYLGLPIYTTIQKLADFKIAQVPNPSFFDGDTTSYFYLSYSNKNKYISEYAKQFNGNTVYVLAIADSLTVADSLFTVEALSNRLH